MTFKFQRYGRCLCSFNSRLVNCEEVRLIPICRTDREIGRVLHPNGNDRGCPRTEHITDEGCKGVTVHAVFLELYLLVGMQIS